MDKKNFINIATIVGIVILVGIVGYFILNRQGSTSTSSPTSSPASALTPTPTRSPSSITKSENDTPVYLISSDQALQMEVLMKKNEKSLNGLQAYRFEKDKIGMTHIRFYAYVNGVRADETIYHFKDDGTLSSITNEFDASVFSKISTISKISESQAISIGSNKIKNSSLVATKEFWNKNIGSPGKKNIVLAWKVHPNNNPYQFAVIDAQLGEIIYYDDGIRY